MATYEDMREKELVQRCGNCQHPMSFHRRAGQFDYGRDCYADGNGCPCKQFISKEKVKHIRWMRVACAIAQHSRCLRAKYGSLILNTEGHVVATGYNGKPAGSCNDGVCHRMNLPPNTPGRRCCLHSEQNTLVLSNRDEIRDGTFYISGLPCEDCALLVLQSGVKTLVCIADDARGYPGLDVIEEYQGSESAIDGNMLAVVKLTRAEVDDKDLC